MLNNAFTHTNDHDVQVRELVDVSQEYADLELFRLPMYVKE